MNPCLVFFKRVSQETVSDGFSDGHWRAYTMPLHGMKAFYHQIKRRANTARRRLLYSISERQLDEALQQTFQDTPAILLVHSSLSRCGFMVPGPGGVIQSLRKSCETLCLPTHTYCYPVDGVTPTYDPRATLSLNGRITNEFWRMKNVTRSIHPTHSLAASGPLADKLCKGHVRCETACGEGTPYEKLVQADAAVLMFGTTMNTYTLFHYSEHVARCSYLYEPQVYELRAKDYEGQVHTVKLHRQNMQVVRRFADMRHELERAGLLKVTRLGQGELLLIMSSRQVHEYTTDKLDRDEYYLVDRNRISAT